MKNLTMELMFFLLGGACLAAGCKSDPGSTSAAPKPEAAAKAGHQHASPAAVPGSHDDWCEEHQVAESQCSRCNPSLVAAFKATGDWCDEHGVPESQCLLCNPSLKLERPPKTEAK